MPDGAQAYDAVIMTNKPKDDMLFTGTWAVVESPDFDDEYMRMERAPYVTLRQTGDEVSGEYHIGLQSGDISSPIKTVNGRSVHLLAPPSWEP